MRITVKNLFETHKVSPLGKYFGKYGDIIYYQTEQQTVFYSTTKSINHLAKEYTESLNELDATLLPYLDKIHDIKSPTVRVFDKNDRKVERILLYVHHAEQPAIPLDINELPKPFTEKAIKKLISKHIANIREGA